MSEEATNTAPEGGETEVTDPTVDDSGIPESHEEPEAAPKAPETLTVTVDGEDVEMPIDEVKQMASLGKAGHKKLQEAARMRKQAEETLSNLDQNTRQVLEERLGPEGLQEFAEQYLAEQLQNENKSEEEKLREQLEAYKQKEKEREETEKERQEREEAERLENQAAEEYEQSIQNAMKQSGIPESRASVRRIASKMRQAFDYGHEITPEQAATLVHHDITQEIKDIFGKADGNTIRKYLGDEAAKKFREAELAEVKGNNQSRKVGVKPKTSENSPKKPQYRSLEEALNQIK